MSEPANQNIQISIAGDHCRILVSSNLLSGDVGIEPDRDLVRTDLDPPHETPEMLQNLRRPVETRSGFGTGDQAYGDLHLVMLKIVAFLSDLTGSLQALDHGALADDLEA